MSKEMRETTTIAEWLEKLSTAEQIENEEVEANPEAKKELDAFLLALFDDVEASQLTSLVVHSFSALMVKDFRRAYVTADTLTEHCEEIIEKAHLLGALIFALQGRRN